MIFSLDLKQHFPVKNPDKAIFCRFDVGPYFGNKEISAYYEPFNIYDNTKVQPQGEVYRLPKEMFDSNTVIVEIEVYKISF